MKKLFDESNIENIAQAIREKNGSNSQYTTAQMPNAIRAIKTQPNLQEKSILENGEHLPDAGYDGFSKVTVAVPASSSSILISKRITENGTYLALDDSADGYDKITVDVSSGSSGDNPHLRPIANTSAYANIANVLTYPVINISVEAQKHVD